MYSVHSSKRTAEWYQMQSEADTADLRLVGEAHHAVRVVRHRSHLPRAASAVAASHPGAETTMRSSMAGARAPIGSTGHTARRAERRANSSGDGREHKMRRRVRASASWRRRRRWRQRAEGNAAHWFMLSNVYFGVGSGSAPFTS